MNAKEAGMTSRTADFLVGLMTLEGEVTSTVQYKIWSIEDDYWVLELRIEVMVHYSGGLPPMAGGCKWKCDDLRGLGAALREATEESGIEGLRLDPTLAAVHVHPVTCSLGVPTLHLDLQFIAVAPEHAQAVISDESLDLRWWPIDALPDDADPGLVALVEAARGRQTFEPSDIR